LISHHETFERRAGEITIEKSRIHKTNEWKKGRNEAIGDKCEWCGTTDNLCLHHLKQVDFKKLWSEIAQKVFLENNPKFPNVDLRKIKNYPFCPKCGTTCVRTRKVKRPLYICEGLSLVKRNKHGPDWNPYFHYVKVRNGCIHKFDDAEMTVREKDVEYEKYKIKWNEYYKFKEENTGKIEEVYQKMKKKIMYEYFTMKNTVTICRNCHYAVHHGLVLCKYCKERYHLWGKYDCCYSCLKNIHPKKWTKIQTNKLSTDKFR